MMLSGLSHRCRRKGMKRSRSGNKQTFSHVADKHQQTFTKNEVKKDTTASECISRLVKNCSKHILNDPELSILQKDLNFAINPNKLPIVEIVTATETTLQEAILWRCR